MFFGSKTKFGIECEIRHTAADFVFCGFRFWVGGEPVGDWNEDCVLGVLLHSAEIFNKYAGKRLIEEVVQDLDADEIMSEIEMRTNGVDPTQIQKAVHERYRQRYLLHEVADDSVGKEYCVAVIDANVGQRIVYKKRGGDSAQEVRVADHEVDESITAFINWARASVETTTS